MDNWRWGISKAPGDPMVVEPPPEEIERKIRERDFPCTSRRICVVETSHYLKQEEALRIARLIAAAPKLLAACKSAFNLVDDEENKHIVHVSGSFGLWSDLRAAILEATGEDPA